MLLRIALFVVLGCLALLVVGAEDYYKVRKPQLRSVQPFYQLHLLATCY